MLRAWAMLASGLLGCETCGDEAGFLDSACETSHQDSAENTPDGGPEALEMVVSGALLSQGICMGSPEGPGVRSFQGEAEDQPVTRASVSLSLEREASAILTCTHSTESTDKHRIESTSLGLEHTWVVHGLLSDSTYNCTAEARCPDGGTATATTTLYTHSLPTDIAAGTVTTDDDLAMTGAYTLFNHKGFCDGEQTHRLVMVDPQGRVRWYWEGLDSAFGVGVVADFPGDDLVLSAGGTSIRGGPRLTTLDGDLFYETPSDWEIVFHHYAEQLSNGHLLSVTEAEDQLDGETWKGTEILQHDPETNTIVKRWKSQQALDAGERGAWDVGTTGQLLNTNWTSRDTSGDWYLSLCGVQRLAKVNPDTGTVSWMIGPSLDWTLVDSTGAALPEDDWPQCQHGAEVIAEDKVLVYDNGRDRLQSRASEFQVNPGSGTVTRTWTWTEPDWYERAWGDVDALNEERVLIAIGHCSCCANASENVTRILEVDRPTGTVVWRYELPPDDSVLYQAARIDGCDVFHNLRYCESRAEKK